MAKLKRSRKDEEQTRKKSLPKLVRRRCNGGECTEEDPISQQCHGEKRRWRRRRGCRKSSSVSAGVEQVGGGIPSLFLGPVVKRKRQGNGGRRRWCGVKRRSLPSPPYLYIAGKGRGDRGKCSTTPTVSAVSRHVAARSGAAVLVTVPLGHDGTQ
jgi:hypothetical protein